MNFRHLEVFYAVMTNGTVTAAAKKLGVSQPSVTTTLQQAEASLGVQLFQRESGRLVPTDEAQILFDEAARAHEALAAISNLAKGLEIGRGGHVRIAAVPTIALELLPNAIENFEARHTGFQYSVTTLNTEEIVQQLDTRMGTFNIGFTFGIQPDLPLASTEIGRVKVFAVIPSDWELPDTTEIRLQDLAGKPYIAGFDHTALGIEAGRLFADEQQEPDIVARSHTHQLAGALVQRGLGYAILDALTIRAMLHGDRASAIVVRPLRGAKSVPVAATYPGQQRLSNAATVFIECFQQAFDTLRTQAHAQSAAAAKPIEV